MVNFPKIEEEILNYWKKYKIFKKSLEKESPKGDYVFYDGPPFATGTPHYGHIVASLIKDIVPRYWTMKGYHVDRKWGWDCHGLPIENIVEKEMGTKSKKDIEKIGVDKFNEICRSKVLMYAGEWKNVIDRIGRWVDMDNDYKTMDKEYMESIWWVFKQLWDKGLIYESYKSMHICPRCETTLSQFEVAEGYRDVKDLSVIVKFKIKKSESGDVDLLKKFEDVYVLTWTTTPWTLPGNVALAVGKNIKYSIISCLPLSLRQARQAGQLSDSNKKEYYILAKANLEKIMAGRRYEIAREIKGNDLSGLEYEPLFPYFNNNKLANKKNGFKIYCADFVTIEDGTGVVHIAPAFGEDDMNLGKERSLPFIQHVKMDGRFTGDVEDFAGEEVKPKDDPTATDVKIIKYLIGKGLLFAKEKYEHSYPYCWRCDSPLLNYTASSWFVKVVDIKEKALETAKNINWIPAHIKEGRFGQWLEKARDWSISRQRFWGSVLPIWRCAGNTENIENSKNTENIGTQKRENDCGNLKVVGSIYELEKLSGIQIDDLHKHFIDKIIFKCEKCGGTMKRIPDVLDCWFESGSMPYAQMHYPFENKEKFEKNFPAEFIAEGVDQTRAWFYYMHILANAIKNSQAFKNVIVNGIVLAEDGKKMSKRLANYPDPMTVMNQYGADALRYYLCSSQLMKADDFNFSERDLREQTRFLNILINALAFYQIFEDKKQEIVDNRQELDVGDLINVLDKWIVAKLEALKKNITERLDKYDLNSIREIPNFIDELSTWYIRRSRGRFKCDNKADKLMALKTIRCILFDLAKIMAPFMPFIAEYIYQELGGRGESVHLRAWPKYDEKMIDHKVLENMEMARMIIELGLAKRAESGIKVRQPLSKLKIQNSKLKIQEEFIQLVKDELNVKEVEQETGDGELNVEIDTIISAELEEEGLLRELVRTINQMRKKEKLTINDKIVVEYAGDDDMVCRVFEKYDSELTKSVLADRIEKSNKKLEEIKINNKLVGLEIKKI